MPTVTLGGDRLGSGNKNKIHLHGYERSTHDMGYIFKTSMSCGTLVPFLKELALPGDTYDIDLDAICKTHPTIGPLFGSFKIQLDVFEAPLRLYQQQLHSNKAKIGLAMGNILMPYMLLAYDLANQINLADPDNSQINPSCILAYLGIRGLGRSATVVGSWNASFNAVPFIAYYDIYKNYYINKQEGQGWYIHTPRNSTAINITTVTIGGQTLPHTVVGYETILVTYTGTTPDPTRIIFTLSNGLTYSLYQIGAFNSDSGTILNYTWQYYRTGTTTVQTTTITTQPTVVGIQLTPMLISDLDNARELLLNPTTQPQEITAYPAYATILGNGVVGITGQNFTASQEGLAIKTYNSDLYNNWLNTTDITNINTATAISTAGNSFQIKDFLMGKKVYDMMNRVSVSDGSYEAWINAVYDTQFYTRAVIPTYHGGLSKELVFQEVVSLASASGQQQNNQPLGTLAGKGTHHGAKRGGKITIKVTEIGYIIGIVSLTPRIDYSQGNKWDVRLATLDEFHKPGLDGIGFEDLITDRMAWWTSLQTINNINAVTYVAAGKIPAWSNYMTNVNVCRGNFAIKNNEMFMTLNRQYTYQAGGGQIKDLTTYIDPSKFNNIFAQTSLDAQNFWMQIAVDMTVRRKMSAKIMPNM